MELKFDLKELDGTDVSEEKLESIRISLNLSDKDDLEPTLTKLANAGLAEYLEMLAGKGMPNRADEAKQDRLLYLIKKVFSPRLPSEDDISIMFQLTTTQSRTLLRNTLSRYRIKLRDELHTTLDEIFKTAVSGKNGWDITIPSEVLVEQFNLIVAKEGAEYNPIRKQSVGSKKYFMTGDTHVALGNHFGS
ncbi:hypothetical protein J6J34_07630 [Pseudidiomarina sp. 1ASP75-14]|uniref:hypothetical protein n=1 Tax=Pseudidiomarina terrestris TaxID=2820060 RepID=UPI00264B4D05|nr:hypothetical protein [Pseudidiomarina sp. 1ASP75-14]MDN7138077.1 hypothetical protein [Pseudidiomarina sp. 1ASP75-14]